MPFYQFHIDSETNGATPIMIALPDAATAKQEAAKTLAAIVSDAGSEVWTTRYHSIRVTCESGLALFTLIVAAFDGPALSAATQFQF